MPVAEGRLSSQDLFGFLRPEQVDALSNTAEIVHFKTGDTVYYQGESAGHIYVVLEGEVMLRLPGKGGVSIPVDQVPPGIMFGSCLCFDIQTYSTTAHCTQDSKLMKINSLVLRELMDEDPRMGYAMQRHISHIYFSRYLETMRKLQSIVLNLPIEAA
jgi:CRP-like cAMP-binding protein